ncbi:MAG: DUF6807 domain-containing protein [Planctomycetota bacterium]|jgi:hypothetical protein
MRHTVLVLVLWLLVFVGGCQVGPRVEFVRGDKRIDVMIEGKHLTSYRYEDSLTKPVLYPVKTPSGVVVNRSFPLAKVEGESEDHPHHVGVFFTYDRVNEDGFWNNTTSPPQVKHVKVTRMKSGVGKGKLSTVMHWVGKSGKTLLEEKREMIFAAGENEHVIDFEINLTAQDEKVVFGDTKEGMFAIRVAHWLREKGGSGRYLSSNGDETEENVWAKRARWVLLQGEKDKRTIGIAILNHPRSVNYPTYWHARRYGLFSANPLGQGDFETRRRLENPQWLNLTLEPGETVEFAFRMIIYEGIRTKEQIEERFKVFVKSVK